MSLLSLGENREINSRKFEEYETFILTQQKSKDFPKENSTMHHIHPRAIGGTDDKSNLVRLSRADHLTAHRLLAEAVPCFETSIAYHLMSRGGKLCPKDYEQVRELVILKLKGRKCPETTAKLVKETQLRLWATEEYRIKQKSSREKEDKEAKSDKIGKAVKKAWEEGRLVFHPFSETTKERMSLSRVFLLKENPKLTGKGFLYANNGVECKRFPSLESVPDGWALGNLWSAHNAQKHVGSRWITDGKVNRRLAAESLLPDGWRFGRVSKKRQYVKGSTILITDGRVNKGWPKNVEIPEGWRRGQTRNLGNP